MTYQYFVAIDAQGQAKLAATKRSAVEEFATAGGAEIIQVNAPNAFAARRRAVTLWEERGCPAPGNRDDAH